jgi:hypothetical protein
MHLTGPAPIVGVTVLLMMAANERLAPTVFVVGKNQYLTPPEGSGPVRVLPMLRVARESRSTESAGIV